MSKKLLEIRWISFDRVRGLEKTLNGHFGQHGHAIYQNSSNFISVLLKTFLENIANIDQDLEPQKTLNWTFWPTRYIHICYTDLYSKTKYSYDTCN